MARVASQSFVHEKLNVCVCVDQICYILLNNLENMFVFSIICLPPQPSGCDPELTGLAGAPLLCSLQSLTAKEIRRVVRPCYAVLASELKC